MSRPDKTADLPDVTLRGLEILRALVERGTTTGASQHLGLSQSAVSRSLSQLETALGRDLFERRNGRLIATSEALSINEELGTIFASLSRIANRTQRDTSHRGLLRIAAPPTIAHRFLPTRIARFAKQNPELEIGFEILASDSLISSIAEARFDVGITDTIPAHEGVRCDLLVATSGVCVIPSRHRLADRERIVPSDLEGEPFIALTRRHSARNAVDRLFERAGISRTIVIETATAVSAAEFVREGLGLSLLNPFPIIHQLGQGIVIRPFEPAVPYRTSFMLPASIPPSAAADAFMKMTRASLDHH